MARVVRCPVTMANAWRCLCLMGILGTGLMAAEQPISHWTFDRVDGRTGFLLADPDTRKHGVISLLLDPRDPEPVWLGRWSTRSPRT